MKKSPLKDRFTSTRVRFPGDESRFSWLPMLLDSYAIVDRGVAKAVSAEARRRGSRLACQKGCANCCRAHTDIPVYPHELVGIYWLVTEKLEAPLGENVGKQLAGHRGKPPCPFLVEDFCSIHVVRPTSCRQFNVFGRPCDEGEDPYFTRRDDVLTPIREYTDRAFQAVLSFYGVTDGADRHRAISEIIHTQPLNLQTYDWKKLARAMEGPGRTTIKD